MTADKATRKAVLPRSQTIARPLRGLSVFLLALALVSTTGCAYRTSEDPTGKIRHDWYEYSDYQESLGPAITARGESEEYLVLKMALKRRTWQREQDQYLQRIWDGPHSLDECVEVSLATLGVLWATDTAIWLLQLGSNDTNCYAQVWAPERSLYYTNGRRSDTYVDYLVERSYYRQDVHYKGRNIGQAEKSDNDVLIFPKSKIPGDYDLEKIRMVNGNIELAPQ